MRTAFYFEKRGGIPSPFNITDSVERSGLAVASENLCDLVHNNILDILAAVAKILSGIEMIRMKDHMLTDTCGHSKTKVGVDVDLADSTLCCLTKLFFRNTDGILQSAAVCVDDLDIFLRNRRGAMKNDREARKSSCNFCKDVKTKLRILARFELVCAVAGSDCDGQRVNAGSLYEFFNLIRIGLLCFVVGNLDIILNACQSTKLSLYDYAMLMSIFSDLFGFSNVLFEGMRRVVDHDRGKSAVNAVLADSEICAVIQMHGDRNIGGLDCSCYKMHQVCVLSIFSCACGCLKDNRGFQLVGCFYDRLNDLHVVDVECADCITAGVSFLEHFGCGN